MSLRSHATLAGWSPHVFALDHESVQVTWPGLGPGQVTVAVGGQAIDRDHLGGPGAITVDGLSPATAYTVSLRREGATVGSWLVRTPARPAGEELGRFMTLSDLHLDRDQFGLRGRMFDGSGWPEPFPLRCSVAAAAAGREWGATAIVLKGDVVDASRDIAWERTRTFGAALAGMEVLALPGNHEFNEYSEVDAAEAAPSAGIHLTASVAVWHGPGVDVVMCNSTRPPGHGGEVVTVTEAAADAVADARRSGRLCVVALHHHLQRTPLAVFFPPGIERTEGREFVRRLRAAGPVHLLTSGHTHRHRRFDTFGVQCTEVGSPKDFPGVWAGYSVFEGGLRQLVRRVELPTAIGWTEYTKRAAGGLWGMWSPGQLRDRCFGVDRSGSAPADWVGTAGTT